jgi:hypothetical protein
MNHLNGPGLGLRLTQQRHDRSQTREQLPSIHSNYLKHISSIVPKRPRARVAASFCRLAVKPLISMSRFARQRPPIGLFVTPVSIPAGALDGIDRYFVVCTCDRAIPLPLQRRMIAENMCDDVVELDTDHTPHLSMTEKLAGTRHQFAAHSSTDGKKARAQRSVNG